MPARTMPRAKKNPESEPEPEPEVVLAEAPAEDVVEDFTLDNTPGFDPADMEDPDAVPDDYDDEDVASYLNDPRIDDRSGSDPGHIFGGSLAPGFKAPSFFDEAPAPTPGTPVAPPLWRDAHMHPSVDELRVWIRARGTEVYLGEVDARTSYPDLIETFADAMPKPGEQPAVFTIQPLQRGKPVDQHIELPPISPDNVHLRRYRESKQAGAAKSEPINPFAAFDPFRMTQPVFDMLARTQSIDSERTKLAGEELRAMREREMERMDRSSDRDKEFLKQQFELSQGLTERTIQQQESLHKVTSEQQSAFYERMVEAQKSLTEAHTATLKGNQDTVVTLLVQQAANEKEAFERRMREEAELRTRRLDEERAMREEERERREAERQRERQEFEHRLKLVETEWERKWERERFEAQQRTEREREEREERRREEDRKREDERARREEERERYRLEMEHKRLEMKQEALDREAKAQRDFEARERMLQMEREMARQQLELQREQARQAFEMMMARTQAASPGSLMDQAVGVLEKFGLKPADLLDLAKDLFAPKEGEKPPLLDGNALKAFAGPLQEGIKQFGEYQKQRQIAATAPPFPMIPMQPPNMMQQALAPGQQPVPVPVPQGAPVPQQQQPQAAPVPQGPPWASLLEDMPLGKIKNARDGARRLVNALRSVQPAERGAKWPDIVAAEVFNNLDLVEMARRITIANALREGSADEPLIAEFLAHPQIAALPADIPRGT